jgi:hypothetical protein
VMTAKRFEMFGGGTYDRYVINLGPAIRTRLVAAAQSTEGSQTCWCYVGALTRYLLASYGKGGQQLTTLKVLRIASRTSTSSVKIPFLILPFAFQNLKSISPKTGAESINAQPGFTPKLDPPTRSLLFCTWLPNKPLS